MIDNRCRHYAWSWEYIFKDYLEDYLFLGVSADARQVYAGVFGFKSQLWDAGRQRLSGRIFKNRYIIRGINWPSTKCGLALSLVVKAV